MLIHTFRAYGGLRKCLFSYFVVPLCFLMVFVAFVDFYLNGVNLSSHNHKHVPFRQSFKSPFDLGNASDFAQESNHTKRLEVIHLARKISIDKNCRTKSVKENLSKPYQLAAMFSAEKRHQLLYCHIPKVASRNLTQLMSLLSYTADNKNNKPLTQDLINSNYQLPSFRLGNENDFIQRGFGNYSKFLFVRHPFERLVSAYYNKLTKHNNSENTESPTKDKVKQESNKNYLLILGTRIIEKYRKNPSNHSLQAGDDVTFPEFVSYVIDQWKAKKELDVHWQSQVELCLPCSIKYDFVGRFETLQKDINFLLHKLKEDQLSQYFETTLPHPTSTLTKQFMDQLSPEQLAGISQVYEEDFKVFGYQPNIDNITV